MSTISTKYLALAVFALGLLHRAIQLFLTADAVTRQVALNPTWQGMQYLPVDLFQKNLAAALLYLQQTPPLPNLVVGLLCRLTADPALRAIILIAFAGILSCIAGALLFLLLVRMRVWPLAAFVIALLFLGNSGVLLLEYTAFGQCFYEQMTMVGCLIAALAAISLVQQNSAVAAIWLGVAIAALALSRATFSYFVIPAIAWLLWHRMPPKYLLLFLLPVALLQGGWAAKQYWVQGHWLWATSTWGGANMQIGDNKRYDTGFANWRTQATDIDCAGRWSDMFEEPLGIFFSYSLRITGTDSVRNIPADRGPSLAARTADFAAYEARGKWLPIDSAGFRELSACTQQMYFRYWLNNPDKAFGGMAKSYAQFWQPIDSYTAVLPTVLVASRPAEAGGPSARQTLGSFLNPPHYFVMQAPIQGFTGSDSPRLVPANVAVIPFAPQLATVLAFIMLHSLPLIAAYIRIRSGSMKDVFPAGFSFLLLLYVYVAGICNLVEYGENMRFRLAVEPVIWSIGVITACSLIAWLRRRGSRPGSYGDRSVAGQTI
jgi:hypothetical protein